MAFFLEDSGTRPKHQLSKMKKIIHTTLLLSILTFFQCKNDVSSTVTSETILMDLAYLNATKQGVQNNDPQIRPAFEQLIAEAEIALPEGPFSVTDKEKLPPSKDKHDYASYSRYWWPDTTKIDGLPYIRKDGITNPESQSLKESDRQRLGAFGKNTETLALAYYLTGDVKYAKKAAELLKVWFLDTETRMNPNVNHAQCRPGHNLGSKSGILDGRILIKALEGSRLIAHSSAISQDELMQLKQWATEYLDWLRTNKMALAEADSKNNHGTFYDVQTIYLALYTEQYQIAKEIATQFTFRRLLSQVNPDGSMPQEIARTRPLFYSVYNLHAMFLVANLAEKVDVDIWKNGDESSRLRTALDFLIPYADTEKDWPKPSVVPFDRMEFLSILYMADKAYQDGYYLKVIEKLPKQGREIHRSNLVIPLMR